MPNTMDAARDAVCRDCAFGGPYSPLAAPEAAKDIAEGAVGVAAEVEEAAGS